MRPVFVTGGTGTLGRAVVARLLDAGREARVTSRRPGAATAVTDLLSGAGVDEAVAGAEAVVHCATTNGAADVAVATRGGSTSGWGRAGRSRTATRNGDSTSTGGRWTFRSTPAR